MNQKSRDEQGSAGEAYHVKLYSVILMFVLPTRSWLFLNRATFDNCGFLTVETHFDNPVGGRGGAEERGFKLLYRDVTGKDIEIGVCTIAVQMAGDRI